MAAENKYLEKLDELRGFDKYNELVRRADAGQKVFDKLKALSGDNGQSAIQSAINVALRTGNKELVAMLEQTRSALETVSDYPIQEVVSDVVDAGYDLSALIATGISTKNSRDIDAAWKALHKNDE